MSERSWATPVSVMQQQTDDAASVRSQDGRDGEDAIRDRRLLAPQSAAAEDVSA